MSTLSFDNLSSERLGIWSPVKLKLSTNNVQYKDEKTGKIGHFDPTTIKTAEWIFRVRGYGLCIKLDDKKRYYFDGFAENEFDKINSYFKDNYNVEVKNIETCIKGWNWGKPKFDGEFMEFHIDDKRCFDINLKDVNHVQKSKNEVIIQMNCADEAFSIFEMRFAPVSTQNDENVDQFYENILAEASVLEVSGESMVILEDIHCLQPRGRYEIKVYPHFIHMRGKTYDYNVPKANFVRFYLLPHPDDRQIFFVMQINPPITHGQTRYYFIVLLFVNDENMELELSCTEEHIEKTYKDIQKHMSGPSYELITKLFKSVYSQKLTIPTKFESKGGSRAITCTYKTLNGFLYPLEKGFIFVPKPTVSIRSDEVACVNLTRASIMQRTFDFDIETKNGSCHTFTGVDKSEYTGLLEFIKTKKYVMSSSENATKPEDWSDDDDEEGDDANGFSRVSSSGRRRIRPPGSAFQSVPDDDDDDDEEDEDFEPPEGFSSASSVAEEYDSEVESSGDSDENSSSGEGEKNSKEGSEKKEVKVKQEKHHVKAEKVSKPEKSSKEPSKKSKKAARDPNAPKKPLSGYMIFSTEMRPEVVKDNPGKGIGDIAKVIGEMWKGVSDEEKAKYNDMYQEKKRIYEEQMKAYKASGGGGLSSNAKPTKKSSKSSSGKKISNENSNSGASMFKSKEFVQSSDSSSD